MLVQRVEIPTLDVGAATLIEDFAGREQAGINANIFKLNLFFPKANVFCRHLYS
jgi:hypothetical protein